MTTLKEVLHAIKDDKLGLADLEALRDRLIHIRTSLFVRKAELKKEKAFYLMEADHKLSIAARTLEWDCTPEGQELLTVQGELSGISGEIDGLQSRIFGALRNHT